MRRENEQANKKAPDVVGIQKKFIKISQDREKQCIFTELNLSSDIFICEEKRTILDEEIEM